MLGCAPGKRAHQVRYDIADANGLVISNGQPHWCLCCGLCLRYNQITRFLDEKGDFLSQPTRPKAQVNKHLLAFKMGYICGKWWHVCVWRRSVSVQLRCVHPRKGGVSYWLDTRN